jgi:hypothetical protein
MTAFPQKWIFHDVYAPKHFFMYINRNRRMRWAGHVARMGEERKVYKVLVGKPEGKRTLGRWDQNGS